MTVSARPPLSWIKRRARRIERFYRVTRRQAVWDASLDYLTFFHPQMVPVTPAGTGLVVIQGGR